MYNAYYTNQAKLKRKGLIYYEIIQNGGHPKHCRYGARKMW